MEYDLPFFIWFLIFSNAIVFGTMSDTIALIKSTPFLYIFTLYLLKHYHSVKVGSLLLIVYKVGGQNRAFIKTIKIILAFDFAFFVHQSHYLINKTYQL